MRAWSRACLGHAFALLTSTSPCSSGTLEFTIKGRNADAFFPVTVGFTSAETLCPIGVKTVLPLDEEDDGRPLRYTVVKGSASDGYTVNA